MRRGEEKGRKEGKVEGGRKRGRGRGKGGIVRQDEVLAGTWAGQEEEKARRKEGER